VQGYALVGVHLEPQRRSATLPVITAEELLLELESDAPPIVLDVRTQDEWDTGVIEGALLLEQDEAPARTAEFDRARRYAVICEGGYRSSQLASWMVREGFVDVVNVIDGMAAWRRLRDR
jgi:rhodanese-related sulfurtransferase